MTPIDPAEVLELLRLYDSGVLTTREAVLSNKLAAPLARLCVAAGKGIDDYQYTPTDSIPAYVCIGCGTAEGSPCPPDCWAAALVKLAEGT